MPRAIFFLFFVAFTLVAWTASAQHDARQRETVDARYPAKSDTRVEVVIEFGAVKVVGWNKNEVQITGFRSGEAPFELAHAQERTTIHQAPMHDRGRRHGDPRSSEAQLELHVPAGAQVRVRTVIAPIDVRDVTGAVQLEAIEGKVTVTGAPSELEIRAVSGAVDVNAQSANVHIRAISGDVRVRGVKGTVGVHTVSGGASIVAAGLLDEADVRTVSGDVAIDGPLAAGGKIDVTSHSGGTRVKLPATANADLELKSYGGAIECRVGTKQSGRGSLDVRLGSGGAHVRVRTFSGDVTIEPRP